MKDPQLIIAIIQAVLTHGVKAVLIIAELIKAQQDATPEDIEKLFITKKPDEYFK
jgi:hypothetical protein